MRKERIIEIIWFVIVVFLFVFSIKLLKSGELQTQVASFGILAPIVLVFLKAATLVIAPLGGTPIYILSGALFGLTKGLLVVIVGDLVGSTICFWLSRKFGTKVLNFFAGPQNVEKVLKTVNIINSTKTFTKARLGFVSMPELLAYASGLSKINFWKFSIINLLFYIPVDLVYVLLGDKLVESGTKLFVIITVVVYLAAITGFALLYKDYEKAEGM